jgi:RHS repeat-associated protein
MEQFSTSIKDTLTRASRRLLCCVFMVLPMVGWASLADTVIAAQAVPGVSTAAGQSATLLPDGRWLLLGGQSANSAASSTVAIMDAQTGKAQQLNTAMVHERSGHSATLMPNGSVLILGGQDAQGQFVTSAEQFDPDSGEFDLIDGLNLTRSGHTATVLTNGVLLIAGGECAKAKLCDSAELYNLVTRQLTRLQTDTVRKNAQAVLQADGSVLILGGFDLTSQPLISEERFDPIGRRFTAIDITTAEQWLNALRPSEATSPLVAESRPAPSAVNVPLAEPLIIRFTQWMEVASLDNNSVVLIGPHGLVNIDVTPVEYGLLLFVQPQQDLLPASYYTLFIDGAVNRIGQKLSFTAIGFTTASLTEQGTIAGSEVASSPGTTATTATTGADTAQTGTSDTETGKNESPITDRQTVQKEETTVSPDDDGELWIPAPHNYRGEWLSEHAHFAERTLPRRTETLRGHRRAELLRDGRLRESDQEARLPRMGNPSAVRGVTALAGQTLKLNGKPLVGVTVRIGKQSAVTDDNGEFLLTNVSSGTVVLEIDGRSASTDIKHYGRYFYQTSMEPGQVNALPQPIWMTRIDTENAVKIPSPTTEEVVITSPYLPGMEVRLPEGTVIRDADGKIVTEVSLTPIPADQPPFSMPYGEIPVYYTIQPGGATIESVTGKPQGAKVTYPNYSTQPPGATFDIFDHDPSGRGWYVYGRVKVSADGKYIEGDKDFVLHQFQASSAASSGGSPPPKGPEGCDGPCCNAAAGGGGGGAASGAGAGGGPAGGLDGDPVSCYEGMFLQYDYDAYLEDTLSIGVQRSYRNEDPNQRSFGVGTGHNYDLYLYLVNPVGYTANQIDLVLGNGGRIPFKPTGSDTNYRTATYQSLVPGEFYQATLKGTYYSKFTLTLKDGTVYTFSWYNSRLMSIDDRWGNRLGIVRDGSYKILQASTPNGRYLRFQYGQPNCATCITRVTDNIGRQTSYEYDTSGRLTQATDPNGGITTYAYDAATSRMTSVQEPRYNAGEINQPKVVNEYYTAADGTNLNGRVKKQTYADGSNYQFAYQFDAAGKVTQTDVTNGRGYIRRLEYTDDGFIARETRALGQPEQHTIVNTRDSTTNLLTSATDALNRTTAYEYDTAGNRTKVTHMAGTPEATITQYTYIGNNQIASITDPLGRTTQFTYDAKGNLTKATDANNNSTTYVYNTAGQLAQITNALGKTTRLNYSNGSLVQIIDPLNRNVILAHDAVGRTLSTTDDLANTYSANYDALDQLTHEQNPMNQGISYTYDVNGNLKQVTDAKGNTHPFTYNSRNSLATEKDPLGKTETYQYDVQRNLIQKTDRKGQTTQYTYDGLNRLTQITYADNSTISYTWDKGDRITQIVDSQNGTITNTWDNLDRLTQQTTPKGTVSYTYYANGLRHTMTVANQPTLTYTYDAGNRLTRIDQAAGAINNNVAQNITFAYDAADRRTQMKLMNGQTVHYTYDDASQLTAITYKEADGTIIGDLTYSYDQAGQRTQIGGSLARTALPPDNTGTVDQANRLTTWNGNTLTYDLNGNLTNDGTNTYTWNARNQLVQISGGTTAIFTYDPYGRRQTKTVNGVSTGFVYDGHNIAQELDGVNVKANYLMGGIDEVFAQQTGSGANAQTLNYLTDALGSPIRLTDKTGAKVVDYTYDPYGNTMADATIDNPFQYTGRENDNTGLYYYRARYYSPNQQRFISEDPIGLNGGINVYGYVEGNPINLIDPWGLAPPPISPNPRESPRPPFDPTPDGAKPSPQPPRGGGVKAPRGASKMDYCPAFNPTYATCYSCCTGECGTKCREACSHRTPPYPDAPFET